ncbi:unnamed protein product [Gongylonema pulchrum]|uniref:SERPIN domain-containing protein n=1 Tax=Gongylonema pulchrum TaxID=637853 RepID=A0A183DKS2_9BILA|nr:unnamed protein product [Gongylonema pulchrum]
MPRFKVEGKDDLTEALKTMGVIDLFRAEANLADISNKQLFVSTVAHKVVIEVWHFN